MTTLLRNLAVFDDTDFVGILDGGQTMCDDDTSSSLSRLVQSFLYDLKFNEKI